MKSLKVVVFGIISGFMMALAIITAWALFSIDVRLGSIMSFVCVILGMIFVLHFAQMTNRTILHPDTAHLIMLLSISLIMVIGWSYPGFPF